MARKPTPALLVTANVGSIFEDPDVMLKIWTEEFLSTVARLDPKFLALHCQEVGGKNYEKSMKHVEYFVRLLMTSEELRLFDKVRVYLDEDYTSAENFTALGNFYFIHESISDILIWDFSALNFIPVTGKEIHSGNIEAVSTKEKSKFPQDFFPECKWSRKGFLRTRWTLNGTVFDLINIHLFHDASNFIAMESFPSVYCKNRRRALEHTLNRFHSDVFGVAPFFLFGDFNFRTDTQGVVKKLAEGLSPVRLQSNKNNEYTKLQYRDSSSQVVLSLGKKEFSHQDHESVFIDDNGSWLKEFDRELEAFSERLYEFNISFPPSYPFEEDEKGAKHYMKTRCPSWCDRVVLSSTAKTLVNNIAEPESIQYSLMGVDTCMGDHKPVFLKVELLADAGTVSCCDAVNETCFGHARTFPSWSCSHSLNLNSSNPVLVCDTTSFLAPPQSALLHEPYTPESMDTPSSSPVLLHLSKVFSDGVKRLNSVESNSEQEENTTCMMNVPSTHEFDKAALAEDRNEVQIIFSYNPAHHAAQSESLQSFIDVLPSTPRGQSFVSKNVKSEGSQNFIEELPSVWSSQSFNFNKSASDSSTGFIEVFPPTPSGQSFVSNKIVSGSSYSFKEDLPVVPNEQNVDVKKYASESTRRFIDMFPSAPSVECFDTTKNASSSPTVGNSNKEHTMRTCRCFSDSWQRKSIPVSAKMQSYCRMRLKSSSSTRSTRLQSHHSSSDEDWFEEVEAEVESLFYDPEFSSTGATCQNIYVSSSDIENKCNKKVFQINEKRSRLKCKNYSADELYNIKQRSSDSSFLSKSLPMKIPDYSRALKSSYSYFSEKLCDNFGINLSGPTSLTYLLGASYANSRSSKLSGSTGENVNEREMIVYAESSCLRETKSQAIPNDGTSNLLNEKEMESDVSLNCGGNMTKSKKCFKCCVLM